MKDDKNGESGLDEEGPESIGPLAAPDPKRAGETNEERDDGDDVREQMSATPDG
jgi:hypothetical protein